MNRPNKTKQPPIRIGTLDALLVALGLIIFAGAAYYLASVPKILWP